MLPLPSSVTSDSMTRTCGCPASAMGALLVMVTTYVQFKMSSGNSSAAQNSSDSDDAQPNQAQAMQQSMGTVMPIMFGFISLSLSVGLSIYFLTSNVVGIIQYSPIGKQFLDKIFRNGRKEKEDEELVKPGKKASKASKS